MNCIIHNSTLPFILFCEQIMLYRSVFLFKCAHEERPRNGESVRNGERPAGFPDLSCGSNYESENTRGQSAQSRPQLRQQLRKRDPPRKAASDWMGATDRSSDR